jgi:phosphohistidine phosphatase
MKTLTILRHAKSSWNTPGLADFDRPLNARGEKDVPVMAERIRGAGIRPSLIVSSPAVRAWSTAKGVAATISYPSEFLQREKGLYHAGLDRLLDILAAQDTGFNSLLLVGHNPGLTDLVNFLVPDVTDNLPTCGFVSVACHHDEWNFRSAERIDLRAYDYPKRVA